MRLAQCVARPVTPSQMMSASVGKQFGRSRSAPLGLALTGLLEPTIALVSGSAALFGNAEHNLSDVSTSRRTVVQADPEMRSFTWTAHSHLTDTPSTPPPHPELTSTTGPRPP